MGNKVQNRQTMIQKERPLVAYMGNPAAGCDNGIKKMLTL